jgi:NAD+ synthase (glutamine-hydrolysing)
MMSGLKIALAPSTFRVGDVQGNAAKIIAFAARARDELKADLILFPEQALSGAPAKDLLLRSDFKAQIIAATDLIRSSVRGIALCFGSPIYQDERIYNGAWLFFEGEVVGSCFKQRLSNEAHFDESRYFASGHSPLVFELKGVRIGVCLGADIEEAAPIAEIKRAGAEILLHLDASPYYLGRRDARERSILQRIEENALPVVSVNLLGGQDELFFDGESTLHAHDGALMLRLPSFEERLEAALFERNASHSKLDVKHKVVTQPSLAEAELYDVLVRATRDYLHHNGFSSAIIGLSGGIDSALTLAVAVDALGSDQVEAVMMPSAYTLPISQEDAALQAERMGVSYTTLPIKGVVEAFQSALQERFKLNTDTVTPYDTTEENLQARARGMLLMALSNRENRMVLVPSNKSEIAVGYTTLYGDMVGGFSPLKDLSKTWVYRLALYRNGLEAVIPERVLTRAPSAELRPDQKDEDSLPPYPILDAILERYIEEEASVAAMIAEGFDEAQVRDVVRRVDQNEYKRQQSAPGVKLTARTLGGDRRYPLTSIRKHDS